MPTVKFSRLAAVASAAVILAIGIAPLGIWAADHLDSPTVSASGATDLTDVYAFSTSNSKQTVLIANVNPGAGVLPNSTTSFGTGVQYNITVDTTGDAVPDITYLLRFAAGNPQGVTIWRNGHLWGAGTTGHTIALSGGAHLWAGLRDDPFFFDLDAFKGNILGANNGRMLCDAQKVDFFKGLNVSSIVLQVPNAELGGNGKTIGVSANTAVRKAGQWVQVDQMGRPGFNTVFNNHLVAGDASVNSVKELFNRTMPSEQSALGFKANVIATLKAVSTVFQHPYTDQQASDLANVLVPDLLTYKVGDKSGFLNGRRLTDDVIDTLLAVGANTPGASDCIANDSSFSGRFPFEGAPN
ncbi:MAG: DUF4331 family protein [Candidatus Limnocylindrales bacterium]